MGRGHQHHHHTPVNPTPKEADRGRRVPFAATLLVTTEAMATDCLSFLLCAAGGLRLYCALCNLPPQSKQPPSRTVWARSQSTFSRSRCNCGLARSHWPKFSFFGVFTPYEKEKSPCEASLHKSPPTHFKLFDGSAALSLRNQDQMRRFKPR